MPDLPLDDINLHYEVDGDGPPLLLLAGMLSDSASWGAILPLLVPHFTVIRPDNRTTGRTAPWDAPVSVVQMAKDAQALMQHLGFDSYHLAGHSMGGLMALELAGMEGGKIASLQIMASGPVRAPRTMAIFDTLHAIRSSSTAEDLWLKALYPWVFHPSFFEDPNNVQVALKAALAYPYAQGMDAMAHQNEALRSYRPQVKLPELGCPARAIFPSEDLLIAPGPAWQALSQVPGMTQITIPDTGHSLHWDAPEAVAEALVGFARSV